MVCSNRKMLSSSSTSSSSVHRPCVCVRLCVRDVMLNLNVVGFHLNVYWKYVRATSISIQHSLYRRSEIQISVCSFSSLNRTYALSLSSYSQLWQMKWVEMSFAALMLIQLNSTCLPLYMLKHTISMQALALTQKISIWIHIQITPLHIINRDDVLHFFLCDGDKLGCVCMYECVVSGGGGGSNDERRACGVPRKWVPL